MALKGETGRLYLLLNACLPDESRVKARLAYNEIVELSCYRDLEANPHAGFLTKDLLSKAALRNMSEEQLKNINQMLPLLNECVTKLRMSIKKGEGWKLKPKDIPDFYSKSQVKSLIHKLVANSETDNITNLNERDPYLIFSDDTLKSVDDLFAIVEYKDVNQLENALPNILKGRNYCFNAEELRSGIESATSELSIYEASKKDFEITATSIQWRKLWITIISLAVISAVVMAELLTLSGSFIFIAISLFMIVALWIVG
ncbi:MAG: hypothetical protein LBT59_24660 [Clostridiales bacterium]|jgi:hypothetical protein|nr:hypothetical protein [Clostridiales bacterium]